MRRKSDRRVLPRIMSSLRWNFRSLATPVFRRYLFVQQVSQLGTWFQAIATTWLVLTLSHSPGAVGITSACQFGPLFILGPYAGTVSDRWPRYRIMIATQMAAAVVVLIFAVLTVTHQISIIEIWLLSIVFGILDAFDSPARQGIIADLTVGDQLSNGIALSDLTVTIGRLAGPPLAGLIVVLSGTSACFFINAGSYLLVVIVLLTIHRNSSTAEAADIGPNPVRSGVRYILGNSPLLSVLALVFIVGIFGFNFQVLFSALAADTRSGVVWFGAYNGILGFGAVAGSLFVARLREPPVGAPFVSALLMGGSLVIISLLQAQAIVASAALIAGVSSAVLLSASASLLQISTADNMRGRVMSMFSMGFLGTAVIGGPLTGYIIQEWDVNVGFGVAGIGCLVAALVSFLLLKGKHEEEHEPTFAGSS
jgi:MFS family permease